MLWVAHNKDELQPMLARLARFLETADNWPIQVKPGKYSPARSLSQNAYLHKVIGNITRELKERTALDYTAEWVKTKLKRDFGVVRQLPDPVTGEPVPYLVSTADYDKGEMMEFITRVLAYANEELGIEILAAGEYAELRRQHG